MQDKARIHTDFLFLGLLIGLAVLIPISAHLSAREFGSLISVTIMIGLLYRCIPYWGRMTALEQALALIIGANQVIIAIGSYHLNKINAPQSGVIWESIAIRLVLLVAIGLWPWLIGREGTFRDRIRGRT